LILRYFFGEEGRVINVLNLGLQEELHNACGKEGIKGKRLTKVGFDEYVCFVVSACRLTT